MRLRHSMACAELVRLHRNRDIVASDAGLDLLATRANDDDGALDADRIDGIQQMVEHRFAGDRVQHLVRFRFHPGALSCGQDDCG